MKISRRFMTKQRRSRRLHRLTIGARPWPVLLGSCYGDVARHPRVVLDRDRPLRRDDVVIGLLGLPRVNAGGTAVEQESFELPVGSGVFERQGIVSVHCGMRRHCRNVLARAGSASNMLSCGRCQGRADSLRACNRNGGDHASWSGRG